MAFATALAKTRSAESSSRMSLARFAALAAGGHFCGP
jgi:hypothetical protein